MKTLADLLVAAKNYQNWVDDADKNVVEAAKEKVKNAIHTIIFSLAPDDPTVYILSLLLDSFTFTQDISLMMADKFVEIVELMCAEKTNNKITELLEVVRRLEEARFEWAPELKEDEGQW